MLIRRRRYGVVPRVTSLYANRISTAVALALGQRRADRSGSFSPSFLLEEEKRSWPGEKSATRFFFHPGASSLWPPACVDAINGTIIIRGSVPLRNSRTLKTGEDRGNPFHRAFPLIGADLRATAPSTPANEPLIINVQQIVSSTSRQFIADSPEI